MNNPKYFLAIGAAVLCLFFYAMPVAAFTVRNGNEATVSKDETIDGNLLISGQTVVVDGNVTGDIICAGQTISITGVVGGDIICAGQSVRVTNDVGGSLRVAGQTIDITGKVNRNVTVAGQTIKSDSQIKEEMFFAAQSAVIGGSIGHDIAGASRSITVTGNIGGNAQLRDGDLNIKNNAAIGGSLAYVSANEAVIDPGSRIANGARRYDPPVNNNIPVIEKQKKSFPEIILGAVLKLMFYLLFAFLFAVMFKGAVTRAADVMLARPGRTLGIGFLFFVFTPIAAILLMITLIGIPVALATVLFFMAAIFLAALLAAIASGRQLVRRYYKSRENSLLAQTVIGVVALWILFEVPILGVIAALVAFSWGLGGVYRMFRGAGQ